MDNQPENGLRGFASATGSDKRCRGSPGAAGAERAPGPRVGGDTPTSPRTTRNTLQNGGGSALAPPEGGFRVGLVVYGRQVWGLQALHSLVGAIDAGNQQAAGEQRSFDRILRLACEEHLLGV